eukprot:UN14102
MATGRTSLLTPEQQEEAMGGSGSARRRARTKSPSSRRHRELQSRKKEAEKRRQSIGPLVEHDPPTAPRQLAGSHSFPGETEKMDR